MNELSLSNDLNKIEFEINYHKQIAGQSVWEIGRRLNHVKENDLTYGEFGSWLEKVNINHSSANRMMKVSKELPKSDTWQNLGNRALYLIATLPEEEREKEHQTSTGETKQVDEMTVRELEEVKKRNKEMKSQLEQAQRSEQIAIDQLEKEENKEPEVIEKEVTKEVPPSDYEEIKQQNERWKNEFNALKGSYDFIKDEYDKTLKERRKVDEKSQKYDELTENIQKLEGKMNETQKRISSYKNITDTVRKGNELIDVVAGLVYLNDYEWMENETVSKEVRNLVQRINRLGNDLNKKINETNIIEGTVINE